MHKHPSNQSPHKETTCGTLLSELENIWDEVGETDNEREKMLFELERECLEAYRKKVDQANKCRAQLRQAVADSEAELAYICSVLGERPVHVRQFDQSVGSLKKELEVIMPQVEEMRKRKCVKSRQFAKVLDQIRSICREIGRSEGDGLSMTIMDESDLSLKRLEELQNQLRALQKEKSDRTKQVLHLLNTLNSLCAVLGMDFKHTIRDIHPTLEDSSSTKDIGTNTIERLSSVISRLKDVKIQRLQKLQDLATTMVELWNLIDTPIEEQKMFQKVTRNIAASENEVTESNTLSLDFINDAEAEVLRLQKMKSSQMKTVLLKKKLELEEICRKAHMVAEVHSTVDYSVETIESGAIDPSILLEHIELRISKAKEEAFNRIDLLDRIEKWLAACEEECWLEEYNKDDNRYNGGRGTHLILKRAEKARALVNKIPAMVEALTLKVVAWEQERGVEFSYDSAPLLSMLEQYNILKLEKEQERQRERDQKKLIGQLIAEQETLFGSKPSPLKSSKKNSKVSTGGGASNKRLSLGGVALLTLNAEKAALSSHRLKKSNSTRQQHNSRNNYLTFAVPPPDNRNTVATGFPVKLLHTSSNASRMHKEEEDVSKLTIRKPLSPVLFGLSAKINPVIIQENTNGPAGDGDFKRPFSSDETPVTTPAKISYAVADENTTPNTVPVPMPSTPSVAMHTTARTPATPIGSCCDRGDVEYSFEERRAGFQVAAKAHKSLLQFDTS